MSVLATMAAYLAMVATILLLLSICIYLLVTTAKWLKQFTRI